LANKLNNEYNDKSSFENFSNRVNSGEINIDDDTFFQFVDNYEKYGQFEDNHRNIYSYMRRKLFNRDIFKYLNKNKPQ